MDKKMQNMNKLENGEATLLDEGQRLYDNIEAAFAEIRPQILDDNNSVIVPVYWEVGRAISDAIGDSEAYGTQLMMFLAERTSADFGKNFDERRLRRITQFHQMFPVLDDLPPNLNWSHYHVLMRITGPKRRAFYLNECAQFNWTTRQLEQQIRSLLYERLMSTPEEQHQEIKDIAFNARPKTTPEYIRRNPNTLALIDIAEARNQQHVKSELELELINKLQEFFLRLDNGFVFVEQQKHIISAGGIHYYIDLVLYNTILKRFVVVDLKTHTFTYKDYAQLDFYVKRFNDRIKQSDDNRTIGILLYTGEDESVAKYSALSDSETLFDTNKRRHFPTELELQAMLQRERKSIERKLLLEKDDNTSEISV